MSNIVFYHTNTCPVCRGIEIKLNQKKIEYTSVMDTDILLAKGINHPPALEVNGELLTGKAVIDWVNKQ